MPKTPKRPVSFRFAEETGAQLKALADLWRVSQNEAVEMAVCAAYTRSVLVPSVAAAMAAADGLTDGGRDDPA